MSILGCYPAITFVIENQGLARDEFIPIFLRAGLSLFPFSSSPYFVSMSRGL